MIALPEGFRFHPPLQLAVRTIIARVFREQSTLEHAFRIVTRANHSLGSRDRRIIGYVAYELVRYWRAYSHVAQVSDTDYADASLELRIQAWNSRSTTAQAISQIPSFAVRESWPDWLVQSASGRLSESVWLELLRSLNSTAPLDLRVNTMKYSPDQILDILVRNGIQATPIPGTNGIRIAEHIRLEQINALPEDAVEVQDAGSQWCGIATGAQPGMRILDACAGGGGKAIQLACLIRDQGKIIARDLNAGRLKGLEDRLRRLKYTSINIDYKADNSSPDEFDLVLLDVPCTGTGTIRRQPERKYHLTPEELQRYIATQQGIIRAYVDCVAVGGALVYVTCSILPQENEMQAEWISQTFPSLIPEYVRRMGPDTDGTDGFFVARFRKK